MTDEQILEKRSSSAMLAEKEMVANERPDAKPKEKVAAPPPVTVGARDPTLKVFRLTASENKPDADFTRQQIDDVIKLDQQPALSPRQRGHGRGQLPARARHGAHDRRVAAQALPLQGDGRQPVALQGHV